MLLAEASPVALLTEERQIDLHLLQSIPRERGALAACACALQTESEYDNQNHAENYAILVVR